MIESRSLSAERFMVSPESMELLKEAGAQFFKLKERFPELEGMGFLGSRTLGREKPESDIDCLLFSNTSQTFPEHMPRESEIVREIQEQLNSSKDNKNSLVPYSIIGIINVSQESTDKDIAEFVHLTEEQKKGKLGFTRENTAMPHPSAGALAARLFLGIGEGLYKNRKYIFDKLAQEKNGEEIWQKIVEYLQYIERTAKTKKRSGLPAFENYPKTIAEARSFFLNNN